MSSFIRRIRLADLPYKYMKGCLPIKNKFKELKNKMYLKLKCILISVDGEHWKLQRVDYVSKKGNIQDKVKFPIDAETHGIKKLILLFISLFYVSFRCV